MWCYHHRLGESEWLGGFAKFIGQDNTYIAYLNLTKRKQWQEMETQHIVSATIKNDGLVNL
jgi:hypothetical protein